MAKEAIKEIIEINKTIKDGHINESISYKNYSSTIKPLIEDFKLKYKNTPNKYLKKYLEPIMDGLQPEFTLANYQHYGNNNLHEFVWACIYYKYPTTKSLFASHSPQLYVLVHSNGLKFGLDYGAQIENNSLLVQDAKNKREIQNLILDINDSISTYRLTQGADYLAKESDLISLQSLNDIRDNWDNRIHIIKQFSNESIPESIDEEIMKTLTELKPLFIKICQLNINLKNDIKTREEIAEVVPFKITEFENNIINSGLKYTPQLITRYISALITKPFVILTGLSGSGKTKLAQAFAQWICQNNTQYSIVPVGADWTNREPLLGYVNALENNEYVVPENGALELIIKANENQEKPYFLILDEMNLSHVERYFADFLSVMESKDTFKLHSSETNLNSKDITKYDKLIEVPRELGWPANLFVIGTVNIDETTYMFSPKVLDRANVIEFRVEKDEMGEYLSESKEVTDFDGEGAGMGESFVAIAAQKVKSNPKELKDALENFFGELQAIGAEFGYRTASEIQTLFGKIELINPEYDEAGKTNDKIDFAIMQKLLPKLHGSRTKLAPVLKLLAKLCLEEEGLSKEKLDKIFETVEKDSLVIKYPISYKKIEHMYNNVIANGFTSYAEA